MKPISACNLTAFMAKGGIAYLPIWSAEVEKVRPQFLSLRQVAKVAHSPGKLAGK
jgi:hypothetical protein